jgi:cation transport regulator ChaC
VGLAERFRKIHYFAYGSNMAADVMERLCIQPRYVGAASLPGYRLAFTRRSVKTGTGVADVVRAQGERVWGVLYEISANELAAIDRKEGYGWAYTRVVLPVQLQADGSERMAVTYTVLSKASAAVPPSRAYLDQMIKAACERQLPHPYLE